MSAEIRILKDPVDDVNVYPLTVGNAVSLEDGSTVQDLANKVIITDQAEYTSTLVKSDSSVYVVKKSFSFGGVTISNPLIYQDGEYKLTSSWKDFVDNISYGTSYETTEGSTYFSFIDLGKRFDSRGANFNENSGDIDNANTLDGWRAPTDTELQKIFGLDRPGATINDVSGIHFVVLHDNYGPSASDSTPPGILVFPDNVVIENHAMDDLDGIEDCKDGGWDGDYTEEDVDSFVEQGCIFMPCEGWYESESWSEQGDYVELISATEDSTEYASGVYMGTDDFSVGGYLSVYDKTTIYTPTYLVKSLNYEPGVYVGDEEVTSGNGSGGGGEVVDAQVLQVTPTLFVKKYGIEQHYDLDATYYDVRHPLMDIEGSEFVLVRYSRRVLKKYVNNNYSGFGKVIPSDKTKARYNPKKGWNVAAGRKPNTYVGDKTYFVFAKDGTTNAEELYNYLTSKYTINGECKISNPYHFGISLRVPNPDYTGPSTLNKNAYYKGVYESLWSEPLMIHLNGYKTGAQFGIGLE